MLRLATRRLSLRPVGPADTDALFALYSDPVLMRYWSSPPWTRREQATESIERDAAGLADGSAVRLGLELRTDGTMIGTFSVFHIETESRRAEIGYALAQAAWGQGYATEAGHAVVAHAFGLLGLNRLEADIDPRNTASAAVLERLGFRREGLLRERWIVAGEVSDSAIYGLLRSDPRPSGRT